MTFLTSFSNYDKDTLKHIFVKIPKNVDIIPQTVDVRDEPLQLKFTYRNLLKFTQLDEFNRQKLHEDLDKFVEWKKNQVKETNEFGIKDRSEEHKEKVNSYFFFSNYLRNMAFNRKLLILEEQLINKRIIKIVLIVFVKISSQRSLETLLKSFYLPEKEKKLNKLLLRQEKVS